MGLLRYGLIVLALAFPWAAMAQIGPGGGGSGGSSAITTWGGATLGSATAWGSTPTGNVIGANVNCLSGCIGTSGTPTIVDETTSSQFHSDLTAPSTGLSATNCTSTTPVSAGGTSKIVTDQYGAIIISCAQLASVTNPAPVISGASTYNTIAASQTAQALTGGSGGATGDYLSHCVVYPTSTSPGVVTVFDGTSSAANNAIAFAGGSSSTSNLTPISIPVGAVSINGAWKVTTGANVVATCYGKFH